MRRSAAHTEPRAIGVTCFLGQCFPTGARQGFGLKAGSHRGEADESRTHLQSLASGKGSLLRRGHQALSSPHCVLHAPDEVPSFSSLLVTRAIPPGWQSVSCSPDPDPDPTVESTAALNRPWRPLLPREGSSGFGGFHIQLNLTSAPSETLRSQRKVFACLPPYLHTSRRLYPFPHSPGPAWNTLSQAAHSKQPGFPGAWPTSLLMCQGLDSTTGSGGGKHSHGCYSRLSNLQLWVSSPWP